VCEAKSRQTENVVKKSNGSEEIYERTEFSALSIFPIINFSIHKKNNESEKGKFEFSQFKTFIFFCGFYDFLVD
jgi:hypothetical protein